MMHFQDIGGIKNTSFIILQSSDLLREKKWTVDSINSFDQIKRDLTEAPVLINLDYSSEFLIFSFASSYTLVAALLQKNAEGLEHPISFFNRALRDAEMR
jgi:hypothetical protein